MTQTAAQNAETLTQAPQPVSFWQALAEFFGHGSGGGKDDAGVSGPPVLPGPDTGLSNDIDADVDVDDGSAIDADADGFSAPDDCDDDDPLVNPDAVEECDGVDNNCDGIVDEGLTRTYYPDVDMDGYGDNAAPVEACSRPEGHISRSGDCNDTDDAVNPDGVEYCNGLDDNCDNQIDEGVHDLFGGRLLWHGGRLNPSSE